jgi:hypothetical protein
LAFFRGISENLTMDIESQMTRLFVPFLRQVLRQIAWQIDWRVTPDMKSRVLGRLPRTS